MRPAACSAVARGSEEVPVASKPTRPSGPAAASQLTHAVIPGSVLGKAVLGQGGGARRQRVGAARAARRGGAEPLPPRPPERRVLALEEQLAWLGEAGFVSVDCFWRTLPLALFGGFRPLPAP